MRLEIPQRKGSRRTSALITWSPRQCIHHFEVLDEDYHINWASKEPRSRFSDQHIIPVVFSHIVIQDLAIQACTALALLYPASSREVVLLLTQRSLNPQGHCLRDTLPSSLVRMAQKKAQGGTKKAHNSFVPVPVPVPLLCHSAVQSCIHFWLSHPFFDSIGFTRGLHPPLNSSCTLNTLMNYASGLPRAELSSH